MAELTARCFDRALSEMGPTQLNIPRDRFYGDIDVEIPQPQRLDRGPGGDRTLNEAAELLAGASFPVMVSGGGVVMGDAPAETVALAERLGCPVVNSYLHNDSFPASHPLWCGPLGYQGSKAAMRLISRADVVLALGTRLGPFGTLPQHSLDYWPTGAKIIQVDADSKMLGLVKRIDVGICGDAGAAAAALTARLAGPGTGLRRHPGAAGCGDRRRQGRLGGRARRLDRGDRRLQRRHDQAGRGRGRRLDAPPPGAARAREGDAGAGDGVHRHRQHQLRRQQLPALRGAPFVLRGHELGQLRLRPAHHHRGQEGCARPARGGLRGRRGLGHEHGRDHDRSAPQHPGHRGGVPQPPVGRREEEPGGLLRAPVRGRRARRRRGLVRGGPSHGRRRRASRPTRGRGARR